LQRGPPDPAMPVPPDHFSKLTVPFQLTPDHRG
jgi:hypothetical protein